LPRPSCLVSMTIMAEVPHDHDKARLPDTLHDELAPVSAPEGTIKNTIAFTPPSTEKPAFSTDIVSEPPADLLEGSTSPGRFGASAGEPVRGTVAGYEILGVLGRGAMGVVYKARQPSLRRLVALKMILSGGHASKEELARFRAEAEAVARLQHPNIVQIYEIGAEDGRPFFSLEYVDGGSLARKIAGVPQPPAQAAQLIQILAEAVAWAHQHGIVHRDLKPSNILLALFEEKSDSLSTAHPSSVTIHHSPSPFAALRLLCEQ